MYFCSSECVRLKLLKVKFNIMKTSHKLISRYGGDLKSVIVNRINSGSFFQILLIYKHGLEFIIINIKKCSDIDWNSNFYDRSLKDLN